MSSSHLRIFVCVSAELSALLLLVWHSIFIKFVLVLSFSPCSLPICPVLSAFSFLPSHCRPALPFLRCSFHKQIAVNTVCCWLNAVGFLNGSSRTQMWEKLKAHIPYSKFSDYLWESNLRKLEIKCERWSTVGRMHVMHWASLFIPTGRLRSLNSTLSWLYYLSCFSEII